MHVTSTEIKNNLGKYLQICKNEQVLITKNGKKYALLLSYPDNESALSIEESKLVYGTNPKQNQFITYKEFLEITENSEQRFELIDGRIYLLGSPGYTHQDILGNLYIVFWQYFKEHEACKPFLSPFDIELFRQPMQAIRSLMEDDTNVVQPDLMVLCNYKKDINEQDRYKGTPTLVAEILSNSSRGKDQVKKLDLYMESGIEEFWLIDPKYQTITVHLFKDYDITYSKQYALGQTACSQCFHNLAVDSTTIFT